MSMVPNVDDAVILNALVREVPSLTGLFARNGGMNLTVCPACRRSRFEHTDRCAVFRQVQVQEEEVRVYENDGEDEDEEEDEAEGDGPEEPAPADGLAYEDVDGEDDEDDGDDEEEA